MNQGIVIVTWSGGQSSLDLLLYSLGRYRKYPFYIVYNDVSNAPVNQILELQKNYHVLATREDSYECGALRGILENTNLDEFIFLQDTIEIISPKIFDKMFEDYPEQSVSLGPIFQFFLGKFRREALLKLEIPVTNNKHESILAESRFTQEYRNIENTAVLDPNFGGAYINPLTGKPIQEFEMRWGRTNLVLRNKYLIKRQGTWTE